MFRPLRSPSHVATAGPLHSRKPCLLFPVKASRCNLFPRFIVRALLYQSAGWSVTALFNKRFSLLCSYHLLAADPITSATLCQLYAGDSSPFRAERAEEKHWHGWNGVLAMENMEVITAIAVIITSLPLNAWKKSLSGLHGRFNLCFAKL